MLGKSRFCGTLSDSLWYRFFLFPVKITNSIVKIEQEEQSTVAVIISFCLLFLNSECVLRNLMSFYGKIDHIGLNGTDIN